MTSTTPRKKALEQRREQHKHHESFKMIIVKVLGQGRGQGKGQQFIFITDISEKSIKSKLKKKQHNFQHPLYFTRFHKQNRVETATTARAILCLEVELRSRAAVLDTAMNISLPYSCETSYWLSGMTKDDRDA